jgi:hypothetical protein
MEEIWKPIDFLKNKYEVSNLGKIRNSSSKYILHTKPSKRGYSVFNCRIDGKTKLVNVHKCVAVAFIPNPNNLPQINHIDGDKTNAKVNNLEWVTAKQNNIHARETGLHKSDGDKAVLQIKNGVIIKEYISASEASRVTGIKRCNICNVCRKYCWNGHHYISAGGYQWKWKN